MEPEVGFIFGGLSVLVGTLAVSWIRQRRELKRLRAQARALGTGQTDERLARLEQAVDAIALEVERISVAQRFTAQIVGDGRGQALKSGVTPH